MRRTNGDLGEALGQKYVKRTFGAEGKERTLRWWTRSKQRWRGHQSLPWMSPETKKQALVKLKAISEPDRLSRQVARLHELKIVRGDALGNSLRANEFELQRQLKKIGKPVDKGLAVSAADRERHYDPQMNNITFPAGILQPPFFDKQADDAINFGGIGAVIGHELTHGFDDQGSQFDAQGNLRDWWTADDKKQFEQRTSCIKDQYAGYNALPDVKLNGKLTLGENTADNGGLRIAYMALLRP